MGSVLTQIQNANPLVNDTSKKQQGVEIRMNQ
jgi:hypothetical protein